MQALLHGLPARALVLLHGVGVNVVYFQARHHVAVQRDLKAPTDLDDNNIRHDHIAFNVDKTPAGLGVEPANHADRAFDHALGKAAQL